MSNPSVERAVRVPTLPPRWFIRSAWAVHRAIYCFSGGKRGLAVPKPGNHAHCGYLHLETVGRRTVQNRTVILAYIEDGPNIVTLAMNGWGKRDPAWWLNVVAQPRAMVTLKNGSRAVQGHAAEDEELLRLWNILKTYQGWGNDVDAYAMLRSFETTVVVLEPKLKNSL